MSEDYLCFMCGLLGLGSLVALTYALAFRRSPRSLEMRVKELEADLARMYGGFVALERQVRVLEAQLAAKGAGREGVGDVAPQQAEYVAPAENVAPAPYEQQPAPHAPPAEYAPPASFEQQQAPYVPPSEYAPPASFEQRQAPYAPPAEYAPQQAPMHAAEAPSSASNEPVSTAPAAPASSSLEQWLGVRGAAAAGSIVLALAGVYFFRYSLEHGLISPAMRVVIGLVSGLAAVLVSDLRLREKHRTLSQFLAGAGFVLLYLSVWAAAALYGLVSSTVAGGAMVAITAASCALSYVRSAAPTAALGLLGGFATPILLSSGQDRPVALFAYLLLLDVGLLVLARKRSWSWLGMISLVLTFAYQSIWIAMRLDAPRSWLGVAIAGAFAILFVLLTPGGKQASAFDRLTRILAVAMAGVLAFSFGVSAKLGDNLVPTATMLVLLTAAGAFLDRGNDLGMARPGTSIAAIATLAALVTRSAETPAFAWKVALVEVVLLIVQLGANAFEHRSSRGESDKSFMRSVGFETVLGGALLLELSRISIGPEYAFVVHALTIFALVILATLESIRGELAARMLPTLVLAGLVLLVAVGAHSGDPGVLSIASTLAGSLLLAALGLVTPMVLRRQGRGFVSRFAEHGVGALVVLLALVFFQFPSGQALPVLPSFAALIGLVLFSSVISSLRGHGGWSFALVFFLMGSMLELAHRGKDAADFVALLVGFALVAVVIAALPLYVGARAKRSAMIYRAAALAGPAGLFASLGSLSQHGGDDYLGFAALAYSIFGVLTIALARARLKDRDARDSAIVWGALASLSLIAIAIPLQLRNEWVTISWALEGAIAIGIWVRFDHPGLKYYATMLFGFAFLRLVLNPEVLSYHAPSGLPVLNWLAYSYLIPAAAMIFAAQQLSKYEVPRLRAFERFSSKPLLAGLLGVLALVVIFVWLNLTVIDAFAEGRKLSIPTSRMAARDLTMSLAWALYAISVLAVGVLRRVTALRYASLVLILVTSLKVFLYDLGRLQDLYRVGALVGLAFSLIGISLAYKLLVFRDPENR